MTKTTGTTPEAEAKDAALPGNHGQFGTSNATEDYKPLQDMPDAPVNPVAPEPVTKDTTCRPNSACAAGVSRMPSAMTGP